MRTLIVVPTYNEIENLASLVKFIVELTPAEVEIVAVDDGSPDGTGQLADTLAASESRFHVIHRTHKMGLGRAYIAGFKWAFERGFDQIVEMDADFSHDPKYLVEMLKWLKEYDVVIGSRYVPGGGTVNWGWARRLISRGGGFYARTILGAPIRDFPAGFMGWRREVLESIDLETLRSDGYSFQIELKYRAYLANFKLKEFPIIFADRKLGQSKMSRKIVLEALGRVWGFRFGGLEPKVRPQIESESSSQK